MGSPSSRRAKVAFARAARRKRRETYRSSYAPDAVVSSCLASRPPGDGVRWPRPSPASGAALEWHGGSRRCARSCCSTRTFTSCYSLGHADFVARQFQRKWVDQGPSKTGSDTASLDLMICKPLGSSTAARPRVQTICCTCCLHCLAALLEQGETPLPPTGLRAAHVAQRFGGRSAVANSTAAQ